MKKPLILCILDGYANNKKYPGNAIKLAKKPNLDKLFSKFKGIELITCGEAVGLPNGQMGNSEVGHLNIGAGRVVYQSLTRINKSIKDKTFEQNNAFLDVFTHVKKNKSVLHLMGLYSPGGVHSSDKHFLELIKLATKKNIRSIYLHLFLDGRDVPPMSAYKDVENLLAFLANGFSHVKIASISGRYYAMDRDRRWKRTKLAYDCMVLHKGRSFEDPIDFIKKSYKENVGDEFVIPGYNPHVSLLGDNDGIIFVNFRPDRAVQISASFTNSKYNEVVEKHLKNIYFVSMVDYGPLVLPNVIAYPLIKLVNTMGVVLQNNNLSQLRIAETEKYPHVTFFFDGGEHVDYKLGKKLLIHSPKVATYDLQPRMSAYEVTKALLDNLNNFDVVILNFANCDMVGHTGVISACIKAVEVVDECVGKIYKSCSSLGGTMIITADHGNADEMLDEKNNIITKHSLNPVPFFVLQENIRYKTKNGILSSITPTMLKLLRIKIPNEMTSNVLIY